MLAFTAMSTGAHSIIVCPLHYVDIVNQAGRAEHRRTEHDQQVGVVVALGVRDTQREPVAYRDVIDFPPVLRELGTRRRLEIGVVVSATQDLISDPGERPVGPRTSTRVG